MAKKMKKTYNHQTDKKKANGQCGNCGNELQKDAKVCSNCGSKILTSKYEIIKLERNVKIISSVGGSLIILGMFLPWTIEFTTGQYFVTYYPSLIGLDFLGFFSIIFIVIAVAGIIASFFRDKSTKFIRIGAGIITCILCILFMPLHIIHGWVANYGWFISIIGGAILSGSGFIALKKAYKRTG